MSEGVIKDLEKSGKLRKQPAGVTQVEDLLREAARDLAEAKRIKDIAERATYLLAYNAMLKAGRALLLFHGLRPAEGGQHKTVVDATTALIGASYRHLTDHFETMRRKRHEVTYEAGALISLSEAAAAFDDAILLVKEVLKEVKKRNPQIELKFEL